ncbi:uncharacterized protein KQ657_004270 [Scheffersomyces spartinae]|uniref:Uncharacterized protein n=1 Tax=Scheffersomyces spartinae TaxID=45513 RepID=A0A9P8AJ83_9ASCO|nr:uncharacterized protein KQ657_004270 [Scheffersomyces spartinae]KAG7194594.1 hypothetical protein KQ657_004270 [Scheffersomyces spartinae]
MSLITEDSENYSKLIASLKEIVNLLKLKPQLLNLFSIDTSQLDGFTTINNDCSMFLLKFTTIPQITDSNGNPIPESEEPPLLSFGGLWSEDMALLEPSTKIITLQAVLPESEIQSDIADIQSTPPHVLSEFEPLLSCNGLSISRSTEDTTAFGSEPFTVLSSDPSNEKN